MVPSGLLCSGTQGVRWCWAEAKSAAERRSIISTFLFDTHTHTPLCGHASGEPEEYARAAAKKGLRGIVVTCHNPMPDGYSQDVRMRPEQLGEYVELVERTKARVDGTVEVLLGLECDYLPGKEDWLEAQLRSHNFQYVLGSVHPHLSDYRALYWNGDIVGYQETYYEHLALSAESGLFDCVAHPDLIRNVEPEQWQPVRVLDPIRRSLDRIAEAGVAVEVNTSGLARPGGSLYPGDLIISELRERSISVVIGSDAHKPERVGLGFAEALHALQAAGFTHVSQFRDRVRFDVSIEQALGALTEQSP